MNVLGCLRAAPIHLKAVCFVCIVVLATSQMSRAETEAECWAQLDAQHATVEGLTRKADAQKRKVRAARLKMDTSIAAIDPSPASQAHLDALNTQAAIKEAAEDAAERADNLAYERQYEMDRANCSRLGHN